VIDDIVRALRHKWEKDHDIYTKIKEDRDKYHALSGSNNKELSDWWYDQMKYSDKFTEECPFTLKLADKIKKEFEQDEEATKKKYPDIFYFYDGMLNCVVSQSQHPAGIIASPINLIDHYGGFINSDGQVVLPINMEEVHEINLIKYDILGLQNVQIIRDTCELAGIPYPKSHEINWNDKAVWEDMIKSPVGIFQFESDYAFKCLQNFKPTMINHMSLVNAAIRPSGESYRERLFAHEINKNPSKQIDDLLSDNNGFLVFQEDVIKFLQDICGLSGSDADNVRRAIGRKQMDRLQAALPQILEGYCNKSDKPREIAEKEAKTFLQIIEDSSNYMFGYNHSTGYSMIGYTCAMLRYYYPLEFITAFLNNARTDDDIARGTKFAKDKGYKIKAPKFGHANNIYICDKDNGIIYKGLGSIKSMQNIAADIMQQIYERKPKDFLDVLTLCNGVKIDGKRINSKSLDILVDIGFFSEFGHPSALRQVRFAYDKFGKRKTFKKEALRDFEIEIIRAHAEKETEKQFSKVDNEAIVRAWLNATPSMEDNIQELVANQIEHLGYVDVEDYNMPIDMYLVQDAHTDKWKRVWMRLYHLASNQSIEYKCDKKWFDKHECSKNDLIKVVFRAKEKLKLAGEDEYGRKQWLKTGEYENIISCYEIIKSVN
jgi:DNA polymerase-3 subunit alpha